MGSKTLESLRGQVADLSQAERRELAEYLLLADQPSAYLIPVTDLSPFHGSTQSGIDGMELQN